MATTRPARLAWRIALSNQVRLHYAVGHTFSLTDLYRRAEPALQAAFPNSRSIQPTIRNVLQQLRDEGLLEFVDGQGSYRRLR